MSVGKKLVSDVFYYFLDFSSITFFGYLFWILMAKFLPQAEYGILLTTISLFGFISIISSLGLNESLTKLIPELMAKGKKKEAKSMIRFSTNVIFYFSLFISLFILIYSDQLSFFFYGSNVMSNVFRFLSILFFSGTLATVFKSVLRGFKEFKKMFIADFTGYFIKILTAVTLLTIGFGVIGGIFAWVVYYTVFIVFFLLSMPLDAQRLKFDRKRLFKFSLYSILSSIALLLIAQGNIIILSLLSSFELVADFGAAFLFGQIILFIPNVFMGPILPNVSELWTKNKDYVRKILSISIKTTVIISIPIVILFVTLSKLLITVFYSEAYLSSAVLFPAFLLGSFLFGLSSILSVILYSANKVKERFWIFVVAGLSNLALSFYLIPQFSSQGAAMAYFLSNVLLYVLLLLETDRTIKLQFSKRSIGIVAPFLAMLLILYLTQFFESYLIKGGLIILSIFLYVVLLLIFKIVNKDDLIILDYVPDGFGLKKFKKFLRKLV